MKGLRPHIKASVIQQKADIKSVADILELAKLAEAVAGGTDEDTVDASKMRQLMDKVRAGREEVQQLTARVAMMTVSSAQSRSPTPECRQPRVSFQLPNAGGPTQQCDRPQPYFRGGRGRYNNAGPGRQFNRSGSGAQMSSPCDRCGRLHAVNRCPAINLSCFNCGRMGHLRAKCRTARRGAINMGRNVVSAVPLYVRGAGTPTNTMSPGPRPICVPSAS